MKTLCVVARSNVNKHVGEEYDAILEVDDCPSYDTVHGWADRIRAVIVLLWGNDCRDTVDLAQRKVSVYLDAMPVYNVMLINLQVLLKGHVVVDLPYLTSTVRTVTDDPETARMLAKLDGVKC